MSTIWASEFAERVRDVIDNEMRNVGMGSCLSTDATAEKVALQYSERIGFVMGLRAALQIAEEMDKA